MVEYLRPREPVDGRILLVPPDPEWPRQYAAVARRIHDALSRLGADVVVDHVGSTPVPGLSAKPILDVLLVLADPSDEAAYVPPLEAAGFVLHLREPEWFEHRLLRDVEPAVNLHVLPAGCDEARRMLLFRDHLRADTADRDLYETTKRHLAAQRWRHVQNYADAKSEVVSEILGRALEQRAGVDQPPT